MKISWLTIIIIGIAISSVFLAYGFIHLYQPNMAEANNKKEYYEALLAEARKSEQVKKRYENAQKIRDESAAAWQRYVANHTPGPTLASGGIDLSVNPWQLAIDVRKFRNSAQKAVNEQVKKGGVLVINGPRIPFPEENSTAILANYFNFPPFDYPIVIWELGTVTVQGTYKQICDNVRAWSNMKGYLAVASNLSLTGTSPQLTGTYNLVLVGFIRGNKFFGGVNEGQAPTTAGGAAGGLMGGPMMGGPRGLSSAPPMGGGPRGALSGPPMGGGPGGLSMAPPMR